MKSHRHPLSLCPNCGFELDSVGSRSSRPPVPGDFSICINCARLLRFDHNMRLVIPSAEETELAFVMNPALREMMRHYALGLSVIHTAIGRPSNRHHRRH